MNQEIKNEWVAALRSGDYKQGQTRLRRLETDTLYPDGYCCLGVLCELAVQHGVIPSAVEEENGAGYYVYGVDGDTNAAYLPSQVRDWARLNGITPKVLLPSGDYASLSDLNDSGLTFSEIADVIEQFA